MVIFILRLARWLTLQLLRKIGRVTGLKTKAKRQVAKTSKQR
jgi:hypothetical protein